jgi:hypothetical protein
MKRFVKEPLLHFLLLGAAIFAVYEGVSPSDLGAVTGLDAIVVSQARIEGLRDKFTRTWHRSPNETELNGLIQDFVREEVAVREAAALGIDRDDSVIRRLLRQRLEFVTEDVATLAEPSEAQLISYLRDHADDFRAEPRISFSQIFFDPQRRGDALAANAEQLRTRLNAGNRRTPVEVTELAELGDATLLEHQFTALPLSAVAQMFGEAFAEVLRAQAPGQWSAPIASAYGEHIVYVSETTPGTAPALEQVREAVRRDWVNARRTEVLDAFYAALMQRYRVTVYMPPSKTGDDQIAELH